MTVAPEWAPDRLRLNRGLVLALPALALLLGVLVQANAAGGHHHANPADGLVPAAVAIVLVMMAPLAVPLLRAVEQASLWWLVPRTLPAALGGYLAVWTVAGVGLHAPAHLLVHGGWLPPGPSRLVPALALGAGCAVRLWLRSHWRAVAACGRSRPVRRRWAVVDAARWGADHAVRCVRVCALPMLLGALGHGWLTLVALTALLAAERLLVAPSRPVLALGYLALGASVGIGLT